MRFLIGLCILMILGCSKSTETLPAGIQYFPDIDLLEDGIVFKYYNHRGKKPAHIRTDIIYRKMKLKGNAIINEDYNAGFQKTNYYKTEIEGTKWRTMQQKTFYRNDTTGLLNEYTYSYKDNVHTDWAQNEASFERKIMFGTFGRRIVQMQTEISDSIDKGRAIKEVHGKRLFHSIINEVEQDTVELSMYKRYEEGLGLTKKVISNDEYHFDMV